MPGIQQAERKPQDADEDPTREGLWLPTQWLYATKCLEFSRQRASAHRGDTDRRGRGHGYRHSAFRVLNARNSTGREPLNTAEAIDAEAVHATETVPLW